MGKMLGMVDELRYKDEHVLTYSTWSSTLLPNILFLSSLSPTTLQLGTAKMVYLGLRGKALNVLVSLVAATAFMLQGYDQAVMNGLVTLPSFLGVFPQMAHSNIEGEFTSTT